MKMNKYFYTFEEVVRFIQDYPPFDSHLNWYQLLSELYPTAPIYKDSALKPHIDDVLQLVYSRFADHYCIISDNSSLETYEVASFFRKIVNHLIMTYNKFSKLLDLYASNDSKLLDKVASESSNLLKYNDTPQGSGDYSDDPYTTNVTSSKTETKSDVLTPMERLKEVSDEYRNLLGEWSNTFDGMFIEEEGF